MKIFIPANNLLFETYRIYPFINKAVPNDYTCFICKTHDRDITLLMPNEDTFSFLKTLFEQDSIMLFPKEKYLNKRKTLIYTLKGDF